MNTEAQTLAPEQPAAASATALTSFSVKQVAAVVNIPAPTLYQLIERGEFPGSKLGGRVRIWRRQLINWLVAQGAAADETEAAVIIERHAKPEEVKPRRRALALRPSVALGVI